MNVHECACMCIKLHEMPENALSGCAWQCMEALGSNINKHTLDDMIFQTKRLQKVKK